jgi:DNA-binding FadR family transcriptional regulator
VVALREAADGLSAASGEDARQGLLRFDHTLSAATHDAVFNLVWTAVLQISGVAPMPIPREISRRFAPAHHEIVDAVERRDDAGARRLMSASRRDLAAWMRAELSETLDRRVKWAEVDERLDVPTDFG